MSEKSLEVKNADGNDLTIPASNAKMSEEKFREVEKMLEGIEEAEEGEHLTFSYWDTKEQPEVRGVFIGFTVITVKDRKTDELKDLPAAKIMTLNGGLLAAQTKAVQAFIGLDVPQKVVMRYDGESRTSNGNSIHKITVVCLK